MMNKPEGKPRVKSGKTCKQSPSTKEMPQKYTRRRGRSLSSTGATESPSSNGATTSRTSSSATMSQLADNTSNNHKSTQKSRTRTKLSNRASDTKDISRTTSASRCDSVTVELEEVCSSSSNSEIAFIPERRTDKTFIYMYDEKEKKSKEVVVPKNIHVTLPVLVQYEITEDTIRQMTDSTQNSAAQTEVEPRLNECSEMLVPNGRYIAPTPELLCTDEEDEMKNKGARIIQWLLDVQCD
ncbi:uncharacterized protein LOC117103911 [Anneissia japonica]|uniref:uncharacterized protein LOC117103911 n=1 Tax=Anneissia japonica TaxID=1529436 RepID=UPI0014257813|nr:uncharacterized protein LOC117103911 [Anneissia japonica]